MKEGNMMANKHKKRSLTSSAIKEIQIKITMRHYFRPARMGILNKTGNNKCWWECGKIRTLIGYWGNINKMVQPLWKTIWQYLKIIKLKFTV